MKIKITRTGEILECVGSEYSSSLGCDVMEFSDRSFLSEKALQAWVSAGVFSVCK